MSRRKGLCRRAAGLRCAARNGRIGKAKRTVRLALKPLALAAGTLLAWPGAPSAQVVIDQGVLDRLGPPRRELPPPAPGPAVSGLTLAPAGATLAPAEARPARRPPPRRTARPRPAPVVAAATAPAIAPEADTEPLPVPPEFVPPPAPPPPPVAALPVPPERPPASMAAPPPPTPAAGALPAPLAAPPAPPAATPPAPAPVATVPAPAPATPPAPARVAAASTAPSTRIDFAPNEADLSAAARARVEAFARALPPDDTGTRVLVMGFADQPDGDASRARRLALARAIEVRAVLLAASVRSTRIDVRALGKPTDGSAPDRVDVSLGSPVVR